MGGRKLAEIRFIDRESEVALSYQIRMAAMAGHITGRGSTKPVCWSLLHFPQRGFTETPRDKVESRALSDLRRLGRLLLVLLL